MRLKLVSKFLISLSLLLSTTVSANFAGFSITDTPLDSIEIAIDNLLQESKLDQKYLNQPKNLYGIKKALLRGCSQDYSLLPSLRNASVNPGFLDSDIIHIRQNLIISTAKIYGYIE